MEPSVVQAHDEFRPRRAFEDMGGAAGIDDRQFSPPDQVTEYERQKHAVLPRGKVRRNCRLTIRRNHWGAQGRSGAAIAPSQWLPRAESTLSSQRDPSPPLHHAHHRPEHQLVGGLLLVIAEGFVERFHGGAETLESVEVGGQHLFSEIEPIGQGGGKAAALHYLLMHLPHRTGGGAQYIG